MECLTRLTLVVLPTVSSRLRMARHLAGRLWRGCCIAHRIVRVASPQGAYRRSVLALSLVFMALGLAILASTLANGGGPLSVGTLLGLAFLAVGAGRLWIASRT
jgi:hypothetical protein